MTGYTCRPFMTVHGTPAGPYWHYNVHPQVLTDITKVHLQILTGITGYIHRSSLTLHGTPTGPYWHYKVYSHGSLLTYSISELGQGWNPAVFNTDTEKDFIRHAQRALLRDIRNHTFRSYWIGGEATVEQYAGQTYLRYYTPELGTPESWANESIDLCVDYPICKGRVVSIFWSRIYKILRVVYIIINLYQGKMRLESPLTHYQVTCLFWLTRKP